MIGNRVAAAATAAAGARHAAPASAASSSAGGPHGRRHEYRHQQQGEQTIYIGFHGGDFSKARRRAPNWFCPVGCSQNLTGCSGRLFVATARKSTYNFWRRRNL